MNPNHLIRHAPDFDDAKINNLAGKNRFSGYRNFPYNVAQLWFLIHICKTGFFCSPFVTGGRRFCRKYYSGFSQKGTWRTGLLEAITINRNNCRGCQQQFPLTGMVTRDCRRVRTGNPPAVCNSKKRGGEALILPYAALVSGTLSSARTSFNSILDSSFAMERTISPGGTPGDWGKTLASHA